MLFFPQALHRCLIYPIITAHQKLSVRSAKAHKVETAEEEVFIALNVFIHYLSA